MKRLQLISGNIFMCLCEVLVGIVLLINPLGFTTGIIIGAGILLAIVGFASVFLYFREEPEDAARGQNLARGLCEVTAGTFCMVRSDWFITTFPVLTILYGVVMMFTGIVKIQWAIDMLRLKSKQWYINALAAVLPLVFSCVILYNPFGSTGVLWNFVAISLLVTAAADLFAMIFGWRKSARSETKESELAISKNGTDTMP